MPKPTREDAHSLLRLVGLAQTDRRKTRRVTARGSLLVSAGALALVAALGFATATTGSPAPFPVIGKPAADFTLIDQTGQTIRPSQFRGKLVLLNFIYTHCVDVCPIVTASLVRVQRGLMQHGWWVKDVVFISVTTDPARDIPEVLKRYAEAKGADSAGWHFLTGDLATVAQVHKMYGIYVQPKDKGLQDHALPTFVIDRKGIVLGAYEVTLNSQDVLSDLEKLR